MPKPANAKTRNTLLWAAVGAGSVLRLVQYLYNRSFWQDEVALALNIIQRDFSQLAEPLANDQAAPYLVLVLFKTAHLLFGVSDYAFRFVPFAFSVAGLALFALAAKRLLNVGGAFFATLLLALAPTAVSFAVEYKQYAIDSFATAWILAALAPLLLGEASRKQYIHAAIAGAVSVWLSFPAVFVLAGSGLAMLWAQWRDGKKLPVALGVVGVWIAFFAAHYALVGAAASGNDSLNDFWTSHMLPWPTNAEAIPILIAKAMHVCSFAISADWAYLSLILTLAGLAYLTRKQPRVAAMLALPMLALTAASMLGLYPVYSRLILFLQPLICLATGAALGALADIDQIWPRAKQWGLVAATALVLPLMWPVITMTIDPPEKQATQLILQALTEARQPGQPIIVRSLEERMLRYYLDRYEIPEEAIVQRAALPGDSSGVLSTIYPVDEQTLVWVFVLQRFGEPNVAQYNIEQVIGPTGRILGHQHFAMCDLYLINVAGIAQPTEQ